jgi:hypothetical protein
MPAASAINYTAGGPSFGLRYLRQTGILILFPLARPLGRSASLIKTREF